MERSRQLRSSPPALAEAETVRVLEVDPELGSYLTAQERVEALPRVMGVGLTVRPGRWEPPRAAVSPFAVLIVDGLMVHERKVARVSSAELVGAGDVLLVHQPPDTDIVTITAGWEALRPTQLAWLGVPFANAVRQWPALGRKLLERIVMRTERTAAIEAISRLVRVDERILAALWILGDRWGRVTPEGVVVSLPVTHETMARIVGARRPSVTTAINELRRQGCIERRDGEWLLRGPAPASLGAWPPATWRDGASPDGASAGAAG